MRFYLISDNSDAMNGLRLAGIEGTVARSEADLRKALDPVRADQTGPLLVTVPSTGGSAAGKDRITRYIREAVGIKI